MKTHTRKEFDEELSTLRIHVGAMADRCMESLKLAMSMLADPRPDLRDRVIELDRHIDTDEVLIDRLVFEGLAREQPVAQDLRVLAATFKLTTDLERIGDEAVNIAESASGSRGRVLDVVRTEIDGMFRGAQRMLEDAIRSFVEQDPELAGAVISRDDEIDRMYGHVRKRIADHLAGHAEDALSALHVLEVARNLERIADHATNVAEESIFGARGEDTRHMRSGHMG